MELHSCSVPVLLPSKSAKLKTKTEGKEKRLGWGQKKTCNFQGCPTTKLVSDVKCLELFSFFGKFTKNKSHNNKPKQRHSACCHVLCAVWWRAGIYKPAARAETQLTASGVSQLRFLLTQRNKGVMIHDRQHAKVKQEKWYKIEIITIHVQHAGLISLMQIFVFFYIIEQAIKRMRFARGTS